MAPNLIWQMPLKKFDRSLKGFRHYLASNGYGSSTINGYVDRIGRYLEFAKTDGPLPEDAIKFRDSLLEKNPARSRSRGRIAEVILPMNPTCIHGSHRNHNDVENPSLVRQIIRTMLSQRWRAESSSEGGIDSVQEIAEAAFVATSFCFEERPRAG